MEKQKYIFIVFFSIWCHTAEAGFKTSIYHAYTNNKMGLWKEVIDNMQKKQDKTDSFMLELVNYQYGYIGWCIGSERYDEAKRYLDIAVKNLNVLIKNNFALSMAYGYKAAFIGYEIGINNYKAPFIGKKSYGYVNNSIHLNPENYFAYLQKANIEFFMPAVFGGSKQKAINNYLKALSLYEENLEISGDWNYLNLLSIIINAYIDMENYQKAVEYCKKALRVESGFLWVKDDLYPKAIEKLSE